MKRLKLRYVGRIKDLSVQAVLNLLKCVVQLPFEESEPENPFRVYYYTPEEASHFRHHGSFFVITELMDDQEHILDTGGCDRLKEDTRGRFHFRGFCSHLGKHADFYCEIDAQAIVVASPQHQPMNV